MGFLLWLAKGCVYICLRCVVVDLDILLVVVVVGLFVLPVGCVLCGVFLVAWVLLYVELNGIVIMYSRLFDMRMILLCVVACGFW